MSYTQAEKMEIIKLVEASPLSANRTLQELKLAQSTFYDWYKKYQDHGYEGLANRYKKPNKIWNRIPDEERQRIIRVALVHPDKSPREVACMIIDKYDYFVSESSVYRILKAEGLVQSPAFRVISAADKFSDPTTRINELWQTDFTYLHVNEWGWYYLSTVMDDYSRYILAWKLCTTMKSEDVMATVELAIRKSGIRNVPVQLKPGLLSDNGSCYISKSLEKYLKRHKIWQTRGKPYHPQTQGKIERYHRSMKNILLLNIYHTPGELKRHIAKWVSKYNYERYHESLDNVTPADMYYGRAESILRRRSAIKKTTMLERRLKNFSKRIDLSYEKCY
jgi:transposase InsO family protein